jgi:hypothetical protein
VERVCGAVNRAIHPVRDTDEGLVRRLGLEVAVLTLLFHSSMVSAQSGPPAPGATLGSSCGVYRSVTADHELTQYWQCPGGATAKTVLYYAEDGESFNYAELRDANGALYGSYFSRTTAFDPSTTIPLADSRAP